jgi:hypothetical protein
MSAGAIKVKAQGQNLLSSHGADHRTLVIIYCASMANSTPVEFVRPGIELFWFRCRP